VLGRAGVVALAREAGDRGGVSDDARHLVEATLHDGLLESIEGVGGAVRLVVDVPFVRAHHGRPETHRYWLGCEGVVHERTCRWREPSEPRPIPMPGESAVERAARDAAWAGRGVMEPVPRAEVLPLWIVSASLVIEDARASLKLEGSVDGPYAWCQVELEAAHIELSESDGTRHDAASFAALGRAYWEAWAARRGRGTQ
jgi:hypothetical protein